MKSFLDILRQPNLSRLDIEYCSYEHQVDCDYPGCTYYRSGVHSRCSGKALEIITSVFTGSIGREGCSYGSSFPNATIQQACRARHAATAIN